MHTITLAVHFRPQRVFAHSVKSPASKHSSGMLVAVYPGGSFMGLSFTVLAELGTGRHEIAECDGHDFKNLGETPEQVDENQAMVGWFEEVLFGYQQEAYTTLEVLSAAERVLKGLNNPP